MGGFEERRQSFPLTALQLVEKVSKLVPPDIKEIEDKSKSDAGSQRLLPLCNSCSLRSPSSCERTRGWPCHNLRRSHWASQYVARLFTLFTSTSLSGLERELSSSDSTHTYLCPLPLLNSREHTTASGAFWWVGRITSIGTWASQLQTGFQTTISQFPRAMSRTRACFSWLLRRASSVPFMP